MSLDRDLRLYEVICARMNVCFMVDLSVNYLNKSVLNKALIYLKLKHPYLKMTLKQNNQSLKYVEQNEEERLYDVINAHQLNDDFDGWKERLIKMCNVIRDFEKSLIFFDLFSFANSNRHQLYCCINHSGMHFDYEI